ncbi:hypothetical protein CC2G_006865 [Coprinopsis cinerea AmutBmut pab1-1]|nr:hypothetical protein CC2G_006865 [Coprinopsis cinerea AmutBmut pab1-1]
MRESNHCFPNQNKACVCINSQLYDRRALDTSAPLPLFNSLTHLSYLTSTSPRIREIMTQDGGLERLVRMLHDYCISPTPPENPALIYGLTPPNSRPPKPGPTLNPTSFDKHAAYRFSLAFQCVVNIGVRGSEHIRSRVVQAGTLDVVGCVLEAWLASKGFAVGPSSSATGLPRETKEQRQARKAAQLEARQREEAAQLQRALQQTQQRLLRHDNRTLRPIDTRYRDEDAMDVSPSPSPSSSSLIDRSSHSSTPGANSDTDMSADASMATTPLGSGTPTGSVVIPNRDRSGTVIAPPTRPRDTVPTPTTATAPPTISHHHHRTVTARTHHYRSSNASSTDTSRPETETEDDGEPDSSADVDMDDASRHAQDSSGNTSTTSVSPSPERTPHHRTRVGRLSITRRPAGLVDPLAHAHAPAAPPPPHGALGLNADAHIIINQAGGGAADGGVGVGGVGDDGEVGVVDGLVSLGTVANDDFAMGAPPGAPGAITVAEPNDARPIPHPHPHPHPHTLILGGHDTGGRRRNTSSNGTTGAGGASASGSGNTHNNNQTVDAPDVTPRAGFIGLPGSAESTGTLRGGPVPLPPHPAPSPIAHQRTLRARGDGPGPVVRSGSSSMTATAHPATNAGATQTTATANTNTNNNANANANPSISITASTSHNASNNNNNAHYREVESGPYRDEDVLLGLQLLAYLSKYPHVRQAFYKPRVTFHPASVAVGRNSGSGSGAAGLSSTSGTSGLGSGGGSGVGGGGKERERDRQKERDKDAKEGSGGGGGFFKAFAQAATGSRGKERASSSVTSSTSQHPSSSSAHGSSSLHPSSSSSHPSSSSSKSTSAHPTTHPTPHPPPTNQRLLPCRKVHVQAFYD